MRLKGFHIIFCLLLLASCDNGNNWGFTLDKNSTEPYGLYLAYDRLKDIFPNATKETIYDLTKEVQSQNKKFYFSDRKRLLISITSSLYLNMDEVEELNSYIEHGGNVLLISDNFSENIDSIFEFTNKKTILNYPYKKKDSSSTHSLLWGNSWKQFTIDMPFQKDYFIMHNDQDGSGGAINIKGKIKPNIISKKIGNGQLIISNSPEMFTNYALLKDRNIQYYEYLLSRFDKHTSRIRWFSKYAVYPDREGRTSNLANLLKKKPYLYAFLVMLLMAVLFFGFETRRRQRLVKVIPPITNDSMAFAETIGKLYYGEKDNANLVRKMIQYYLEHIRTTYNLPTAHLNKELAEKLSRKLNKTNEESAQFIDYLNQQLTAYSLSELEIKQLYKTLKKYS